MVMIGIVAEELKEENYEHWKICLKNYLIGQGLWGVVSGKEPKIQKNQPGHEEWKRNNALALHAIQLSCGKDLYSKFKKQTHVLAKYAWDHLVEKALRPKDAPVHHDDDDDEESPTEHNGTEHHQYDALYKAVEEGNLHDTKQFIHQDSTAVKARISSHNDTALHIAILNGHIRIAEELLKLMSPEDLELTNENGSTCLHLAAISGVNKLARAIVEMNRKLLTVKTEHDDGLLPVIVASMYGQRDMVSYLYEVTPIEELSPERGNDGATLLNSLITSEFYDVASKLLKKYPHLGVMEDHYGKTTLRQLAHKPSAFLGGTKFIFLKRWIYNCVTVHTPWASERHHHNGKLDIDHTPTNDEEVIDIPVASDDDEDIPQGLLNGASFGVKVSGLLHELGWGILRCLVPDIKHIRARKLVYLEAVNILNHILMESRKLKKSDLEKMEIDKTIHDAIKFGIVEFIEEFLKCIPEIIWRKDKKERTIFAHAIIFRQEKIFNLIYQFGTKKSIIARQHDIFGNNFLHMAAKLSPPSQLEKISGAALQMQRELQWFKEVESMVQPKCKEETNEYHKTPSTLFTEEHKELIKEGERWMKNTAGSSMIVGTLIAAVMFTTAFTVPGGNLQESGLPTLLKKDTHAFIVFMASNSLSMFTSSTSILMFLGILTARYAEEDFLESLPKKLIFGLACLFLAIVTMMVSFGSSIYLMMQQDLQWVTIPIIVLSTVPVAFFSTLQFPLLVEMIFRTYGAGIFERHKKLPSK